MGDYITRWIIFVGLMSLDERVRCRSDAAGRVDLFVVHFFDFSFIFEFEQFALDSPFKSFCSVVSVGSYILEGGFGFFFESVRLEGDKSLSLVMGCDGNFLIFYLLLDQFKAFLFHMRKIRLVFFFDCWTQNGGF